MRENKFRHGTCPNSVSIIVPVLNEEKEIHKTVQYLRSLDPPPLEIIVVDGGSTDDTILKCKQIEEYVRVIESQRGRAAQMNAGAADAKGDVLLFVHCDSRPPRDAINHVTHVLNTPRNVLGGFATKIEYQGRMLLLLSLHQLVKTYIYPLLFRPLQTIRGLRCMFGDQSLFCRREDFNRVGGFDETLVIMEDADLCLRLHEYGLRNGTPGQQVQVLKAINVTSGRRLAAWGTLRATYIHFRIGLAWFFGVSHEELYALYHTLYTDSFR